MEESYTYGFMFYYLSVKWGSVVEAWALSQTKGENEHL